VLIVNCDDFDRGRLPVTASPAYMSAPWLGRVWWSGRHSVAGTTPGATSGSPPNRAVTCAWLRAVIPAGTMAL
jgi:hypothetical protein